MTNVLGERKQTLRAKVTKKPKNKSEIYKRERFISKFNNFWTDQIVLDFKLTVERIPILEFH